MKHVRKDFIAIVIASKISSYAFHTGEMRDSAVVQGNEFELINVAQGSARTTHILGIGGLEKAGLVAEARRNMYLNNPLQKGQTYANLSVDFKRSLFIIAATTEVFVTADIVQFYESDEVQSIFENRPVSATIGAFSVDEKLGYFLDNEVIKVKLLGINEYNRYTLEDESGQIYSNAKRKEIIIMNGGLVAPNGSFKVGDQVKFKTCSD